MTLLQRLRERVPGARSDLTVETFEYVRVGSAALVRAAGSWAEPVAGAREVTLRVRSEVGHTQEVEALAEADPRNRRSWKAAFPLTTELVEDAAAEFSLHSLEGSIDLPRPVRRALRADDELEGRVREAEAGLRWLEEQLRNERERRRRFEREMASLEERNQALRGELLQLSEFALESAGLTDRMVR